MNNRTKLLATTFGVLIAGMGLYYVVYPIVDKHVLSLDKEVADRRAELEELEQKEMQVQAARAQYRDYLDRVGAVDVLRVENDLRSRLVALIEKHGLSDWQVGKGRVRRDKKTDLQTLTVTVDAVSTLESTVQFLRELSEFPDVMQVSGVKLSPMSSSRRSQKKDRVSVDVLLSCLVLPEHQQLKGRVEPANLKQPEALVRHDDLDYSRIWRADPFNEYVKQVAKAPPPPIQREEPKEVKPPPPPPPPEYRWKDAGDWQLAMALLLGDGSAPRDEFMMVHTRNHRRKFVPVGNDFDGGQLLFVHQRGALVVREDGSFVYPLGESLDRPVPVARADKYPELQAALARLEAAGRVPDLSKAPPPTATPSSGEPEDDPRGEPSRPGASRPASRGDEPATAKADPGDDKPKRSPVRRRSFRARDKGDEGAKSAQPGPGE